MTSTATETRTLRLGTRGSRLALTQSRHVADALESAVPGLRVELITIQTTGDKVLDSPLSTIGGKGVFTKEIEEALLDGRVDLAVHSLKDLPTTQPPGLALGAVTRREDPSDLLIANRPIDLQMLGPNDVIGTSSLRRRAELRLLNRRMRIEELRGNVPTRIKRLQEGDFTAIVLASAGVSRLGLELPWSRKLTPEEMLPAPGQGSLGIQIREGDEATRAVVALLHDRNAGRCCSAERLVLQELGGGCQLPLGTLALMVNERIHMWGRVASIDGHVVAESASEGPAEEWDLIAQRVAEGLAKNGARAILAALRSQQQEANGYEKAVERAKAMSAGGLGGMRVLITRDEDADGALSLAVRARGGDPALLPLVRHLPPDDPLPLHRGVLKATEGKYDWMVFTSSRAIDAVCEALTVLQREPESVTASVACVGKATAKRAWDAGFIVELVPEDSTGETLAKAMIATGVGKGSRVLYPKADKAAEAIENRLTAVGAVCDAPVAYRTEIGAAPAESMRWIESNPPDAILFCSPSAVEGFVESFPSEWREKLLERLLVGSIGPRTSESLAAAGIAVHVEPKGERTFEQLVDALASHRVRV